MATLTVYQSDLDGMAPTYVAANAGGDEFPNDGRTMLHVKNGSAGTIVVTVNSRVACNQGYDHDSVTSIGAGLEAMVGPFDITRFNDTSTSRAAITYDAVTSLTIAAIKVA